MSSWSAWAPEQSRVSYHQGRDAPDMHKALDLVLSTEEKASINLRVITPHFINCCLQSASSWGAGTWQQPSESSPPPAKVTVNLSGKETASEMRWSSCQADPVRRR